MENVQLLELAKQASKNAYAPYSNFKVGACVFCNNGHFYKGCNVENVSYGLSLCAERNALAQAVEGGDKENIEKIAIFSPNKINCVPCGACRQWFLEFNKDITVIVEGKDLSLKTYTLEELLPNSFAF